MSTLRREPNRFWRDARRAAPPVGPELPPATVVRVPGRGDVFVRYQSGPAGAPTVLLLHGWMASADVNWMGAFHPLAEHYHVLAVDHRGHGRGIRTTEAITLEDCADDAAGVMAELGVTGAIAVGFSMGGPISLLLARRHPERVGALVMAATALEMGRTGKERGMGPVVRLLNPLFRLGLPDAALRLLARRPPAVLGDDLAELAPWLGGEMKRLHPSDISSAGAALARFDARGWAASLGVPAASVITTRDRAVAPHKQRAAAEALGATHFELDAGHTVCVTEPEGFGFAIRRAVDEVAGALPRPVRGADEWTRVLGRVRARLEPVVDVTDQVAAGTLDYGV